ncbi:MAG: MMPL family transporter, partial [Deltaproteobacteria bacterium]|nr:MMPL family transporter [Deltaproteobacteria bacterium]
LPFAVQLYRNLRSAIEELLPRNAPSVVALDELHRRLGEHLQLSVLVSGAASEDLHRFADALAEEAARLPQPPRVIDYRPGPVQDFFLSRRLLFADLDDLHELSRRIEARIEWEVQRSSPMFDLGLEEPEEPPGFEDLFARYRERGLQLKLHPSGYYDGADGRSLAMVIYPAHGVSGYESSLAFRDRVQELARQIATRQGLPQLEIEFGGDVQSMIEEQHALISDLLTSSLIVLFAEALLLLAFFRWWGCLPVLGFPLGVATAITFAIGWFAIGSVNASTAFLGSIIVGNGVNSGLILLSRVIEERRSGNPSQEAMLTAVHATALATFIAALAAALSYGALMVSSFRGYTQFGFLGGIGMVLCWGATFVWLPPLGLALERRFPVREAGWSRLDRAFASIARLSVLRKRPVIVLTALLVAAAGVALVPAVRDPLEHDINKLRSRAATAPGGSQDVNRRVNAILGRFLTPIAVLLNSPDQVAPLADRYRQLIERGGPDLVLGSVLTLQSFVPEQQPEKIRLIRHIREQLSERRLELVDEDTRRTVREWIPPADLRPFTVADLPDAVRREFRELDGSEGKLLLLFPKSGTSTSDGRVLARLEREVRSVPQPPGMAMAGSMLLFADVFKEIAHDGPVATLVALTAVVLLSLFSFRGRAGGIGVPLSLLVGVIWMLGFAAALGARINFLNFAALPITFGIGIDYGTNIYRRYLLGAPDAPSLIQAIGGSGAAVAVCSATTVIGYSSLLLSRNGALYSFGLLAVIGEIACLLSALLLLPALLVSGGADTRSASRETSGAPSKSA